MWGNFECVPTLFSEPLFYLIRMPWHSLLSSCTALSPTATPPPPSQQWCNRQWVSCPSITVFNAEVSKESFSWDLGYLVQCSHVPITCLGRCRFTATENQYKLNNLGYASPLPILQPAVCWRSGSWRRMLTILWGSIPATLAGAVPLKAEAATLLLCALHTVC